MRHSLFSMCLLLLMVPWGGPTARAAELSAGEIMRRVNDRDDGDDVRSDLEMILVDKSGNERVRQLRSFSKDYDADTRQVLFFLSPADVRDTGFLTYDYSSVDKDDDQWLYLPALKRTKRVASSDQSGSFLGSDFNYADLTERPLDRYDFELMKEVDVRGERAWQILATPKTQDEIDRTGYTKSILFVLQDSYVVVRAANWMSSGDQIKYLDVKKLERIDGIWVPTETHMTTKRGNQTLHKTVLRTQKIEFNQSLDDVIFTTRQLEKGL